MMQRAIVDLPQPDSPTTPSVSPSRTVKLTPSTAFTARDLLLEDDPARDREVLLQVLDDEQLVAEPSSASHVAAGSAASAASAIVPASSFAASRSFVSSSRWQALQVRRLVRRPAASSGSLVLQMSIT